LKAKEARALGERIAWFVEAKQVDQAFSLLSRVLAQRTPFSMLDRIGKEVGNVRVERVDLFLQRVGAAETEGGWAVIGAALRERLDCDLATALGSCRAFISAGDVWYAADILGERVPGPALVKHFRPALDVLEPWREDPNQWVRRSVGVGAHFWAKRSKGATAHAAHAEALLAFLEPLFVEWDMAAVKGVGWGLKTLGKHYPDLVADWLSHQVVRRGRRHRAVVLRKALTYLNADQRARATGSGS
jgi:hypothetical protein